MSMSTYMVAYNAGGLWHCDVVAASSPEDAVVEFTKTHSAVGDPVYVGKITDMESFRVQCRRVIDVVKA